MNEDAKNAAGLLLMSVSRVDKTVANMTKQTMETQRALRAFREQEVKQFREDMTAALHEQQQRFDALMRPKLIRAWQFVGAMGTLVLVLVGGAVGLNYHYLGVIQDNKQSAEWLKAVNRADVTLCDGVLCARIDTKARRWGAKGEYQLVKPR
ncbi:hypothetical protein [Luteibacter sp. 329MFSha]|uniref:hypothetical protein n=1 Tax=Luteibacter sp. 329MFSha TaxID=1798239 RepID=UPI0008D7F6B8|nr:hypothetical protein [Luteibacter sp. 329MFSha]SEW03941.1 hypothetical protein SAMN04515660_2012 [Luteibacter sp. 329MFSha]